MTNLTEEQKVMAAKVYEWFQDRLFMEKYGKSLRKSRYTTLMRIFKKSGTYTITKGGAYFWYFKLRDIGHFPYYNTSRLLFILSLLLPLIITVSLLAAFFI
jgi:hypothetical protein